MAISKIQLCVWICDQQSALLSSPTKPSMFCYHLLYDIAFSAVTVTNCKYRTRLHVCAARYQHNMHCEKPSVHTRLTRYLTHTLCSSCSHLSSSNRSATTAEKLRETKVWVPTPGHLRQAKGRLGVGCGRVQGYHPWKIF